MPKAIASCAGWKKTGSRSPLSAGKKGLAKADIRQWRRPLLWVHNLDIDYAIHPLKGFNDIEFGMHVSEVRRRMPEVPENFRRGSEVHSSDYYVEEGVFCYYDPEGHLEAAEFSSLSHVFLNGISLFELPFGPLFAALSSLDPKAGKDHDGAISRLLSLGIWVPDANEGDAAPAESILAGRPGYFDFLDEPGS